MIRALIFSLQIAFLAFAAWWVAQRPGTVEIDWLGYNIDAQMGAVLFILLVALVAVLMIHRLLLFVESLPKLWRQRRERQKHEKGYQALILGFSAVAAGDGKIASYQAHRARQMLPREENLTLLLQAQAAHLSGHDNESRDAYERLFENKDTAFLGLRGLLAHALDRGETSRALELAQQARKTHPRQPWVLRTVYELELRARQWSDAAQTLDKLEKAKITAEDDARRDRIALFLQMAQEDTHAGFPDKALGRLRRAHKLDNAFVPAALNLASFYIARGQRRAAIAVIEKAWKINPHPEFVPLWGELAPANKPSDIAARLRWFEKLVALNPRDAESQMAAAKAAMEDGLWGEARQYLLMADGIRPSARLYRLWARLEERQNHPETARQYLEKAADAAPEKVWVCRKTGHIYDRWHAVAEPHGTFNTIAWDYPQPRALRELREDSQATALVSF